jgi:hypothetical protein
MRKFIRHSIAFRDAMGRHTGILCSGVRWYQNWSATAAPCCSRSAPNSRPRVRVDRRLLVSRGKALQMA